MTDSVKLAVVESELMALTHDFKRHAEKDDERFDKVGSALVRIERILWVGLVGLAGLNGPDFLSSVSAIFT